MKKKSFKIVFVIYVIFLMVSRPGRADVGAPLQTAELQTSNVGKSIEDVLSSEELPKATEPRSQGNETNLTIYKDAALVKRRLALALEAGTHLYKVDGIAATIYPPSLMMELQSDSKSGRIQEYSLKPDSNLEEATSSTEKFLQLTIAMKQADSHNHLTLFYLFRNLGWRVDYTLELSPTYESLTLNTWVEIINQAGIDFNKAKIQLIDSDVPTTFKEGSSPNLLNTAGKPAIYSIPCLISLGKNSAKKVNWVNSRNIQIQRQYRLYVGGKYLQDLNNKAAQPLVETWINFSNSQKQSLGLPLPAGQATLYSQNAHGNLELLGVVDVPSTAVDQDINLKIPSCKVDNSTAKDSEETKAASTLETVLEQTEFKKLTDKATEANYRLCLKNKGSKPIIIQVILDLPVTNCKVIKENKAHTIDSLKQYSWVVEIPPESEVDLKYRLQVDLG